MPTTTTKGKNNTSPSSASRAEKKESAIINKSNSFNTFVWLKYYPNNGQ